MTQERPESLSEKAALVDSIRARADQLLKKGESIETELTEAIYHLEMPTRHTASEHAGEDISRMEIILSEMGNTSVVIRHENAWVEVKQKPLRGEEKEVQHQEAYTVLASATGPKMTYFFELRIETGAEPLFSDGMGDWKRTGRAASESDLKAFNRILAGLFVANDAPVRYTSAF